MAEAAALWRPREEGLRVICGLLEQSFSPNADQSRISQQLQRYNLSPVFNNYLVFILAHAEGKPLEVRQAAGLLLKNNLRTSFTSLSSSCQQYIKLELLPCLGATDKTIRSTVGTVISTLVQQVQVFGWPELLQALSEFLGSNDYNHMEGAIDAIYKIYEDIPEALDVDIPGLSERPINILMPRLLHFFQSPHATLRKLSLGSINKFIVNMPSALFMSMDQYLQGLFHLGHDSSADVRKLVCSAFVQLIEIRPTFLEPHLRNVTEYMLQANNDPDEEVALEACEFWLACCDGNMSPDGLREYLPRLIPVLISNLVYADDDESLDDAEEDESFPDRDQDIKPRFHSPRLHGSNNGEAEIHQEIVPVVVKVVLCLVSILQYSEILNKSLIENSAVTLGRLGWVCTDIVASQLEIFIQSWCTALCMIRDDYEKEEAFRGLFAMIRVHPRAALRSIGYLCKAVASWNEIRSKDFHDEVCRELKNFKEILVEGSWEQCIATLDPSVAQRLSRYGV